MKDFLLGEYSFLSKEEEKFLKEHINDKKAIEEHVAVLERRYNLFKTVYAINTTLIKVVPILILILYLVTPSYLKVALIAGVGLIVVSECVRSFLFSGKKYEAISRNILILKGMGKLHE